MLDTVVATSLVLALVGSCQIGGTAAAQTERALPAPRKEGGAALAEVLATRRSVRTYAPRAIDDAELGQLLWAAQGASDGHRTAPSAGALYPLAVHAVDASGVWRYVPADHAVVRELAADRRASIAEAAFGQDAVRDAPVALVISADFAITAHKYGARAERFATLEAGHAAQNVLLTATALGLGAVPIGAFDDGRIRRAVGLPASRTPLYVIPIGALP
jgi:SagB-type dehydrogenase family enzyme